MPAYGSNPWLDVAGGTAGANQSMANIALMQRQAQFRMQQLAAQQALEQQKIDIERGQAKSTADYQTAESERARAQAGEAIAQTGSHKLANDLATATMARQGRVERLKGYEGAPDIMSMVQDPFSGPQMMGDLRAANVVPQGQFQLSPQQLIQALHAALGAQVYGQAAGTPGSAERLASPMTLNPNEGAYDRFSGQLIQQAPPAPLDPFHMQDLAIKQAQADELARHHGSLEKDSRTRALNALVANPMMQGGLRRGAQQGIADTTGLDYTPTAPEATVPFTDDRNFIQRLFNTTPSGATQAPAQPTTFSSEQEARSKGAKSGDIVTIQGIGKVRLH